MGLFDGLAVAGFISGEVLAKSESTSCRTDDISSLMERLITLKHRLESEEIANEVVRDFLLKELEFFCNRHDTDAISAESIKEIWARLSAVKSRSDAISLLAKVIKDLQIKQKSAKLNLKTGVALGLLDLLPGEPTGFVIRNRSHDAEYSAQAPFKFYVGKKKQGKLNICLQKNEDYGLWHKLDTVKKSAVTRLYFTTDPRILEDESLGCTEYKLEHTEDSIGFNLFIRATGPNTLEWIATDGEKVQESQSGQSIVLK